MSAELGNGHVPRNAAQYKNMSTDEFANKMMDLFWSEMIRNDGRDPAFTDRFAKSVGFNEDLEG